MELGYAHEEADSKLLLHVSAAASEGFLKIAIQSPDTYVAIIRVFYCGIGAIDAELLFLIGTHHRKRYANLSRISTISGTLYS